MANFQYKAGLHNVGSYQVSGKPFATGSITCRDDDLPMVVVKFPSVTSWIVVTNSEAQNAPAGSVLRVGFSENGCEGNDDNSFLEVSGGVITPRLDLKVSELWLSGSTNCSVMAGLTFIGTDAINNSGISPNGTNWSGAAGV